MGKMELQALLFVLASCSIVKGQLDSWNTITYTAGGSTQPVTARIVRAPEVLNCPMDPNDPCTHTLNVSSMLTMTLYPYNSSETEQFAGGWRYASGYAAKVNADGSFAFQYDNAQPPAYEEFLWPVTGDGTKRSVLTVNNRMPGPTIVTRLGQILRVKVINSLLSESISIHWHGLHQNGTPWMDGVPLITQCPILPYSSFTYEFTLKEVGTHWYHSHSGATRTDGLFGAIVVTSPNEFDGTDVDPNMFEDLPGQHTMTVIDYQHEPSTHLFDVVNSGAGFNDPTQGSSVEYEGTTTDSGVGTASFPFLSGLINTAGWFFQPPNDANCTPVHNIPLTFFHVERGKAYRFRAIGTPDSYSFRLSVQGHKLRMLSTDGIPTKSTPEEVDFIIIHSAERYDFILNATATSQPDGYYWLTMETLETQDSLQEMRLGCFKGHRSYAIVKYNDATPLTTWPLNITYDPTVDRECYSTDSCVALNCPFRDYPSEKIRCVNVDAFQLRRPVGVPNNDVSSSVFLNFGFEPILGSAVNGRHFVFPPSPPVTQWDDLQVSGNTADICEYTQEANPPGRVCMHTYTSNTATVEMVFMNLFSPTTPVDFTESHIIHFHGHYFRVLHIGYGNCTSNFPNATCSHEDITCGYQDHLCNSEVSWTNGKLPDSVNISNRFAPLKDTVVVPAGAYVVVRYETNNPGWWFLHCHIELHQLGGMVIVVAEDIDQITNIPSSIPTCANFPPGVTEEQPSTGPLIVPTTDPYQPLSIIFIVATFILLVAVVVMVIICIASCTRQDGCLGWKVYRIAMEAKEPAVEVEMTTNVSATST